MLIEGVRAIDISVSKEQIALDLRVQHKFMQVMAEREERYVLDGKVQVDDAYLGGESSGGKVGRGSESKVPFVAAVSLSEDGRPLRIKLTPVSGFTLKAISPEFDTFEAHFSLTPCNGAGFRASSRKKPRYMDC